MAFVFFMTIPGLAVVLVVLAVLERAGSWLRMAGWRKDGRAARPRDGRRPASAVGMELFGAVFQPEGHHALERRKLELVLRDEDYDGAPPRVGVDLDRGVITIRSDPGHPPPGPRQPHRQGSAGSRQRTSRRPDKTCPPA